jgi:multiple sugar transport system substrate-binding protein
MLTRKAWWLQQLSKASQLYRLMDKTASPIGATFIMTLLIMMSAFTAIPQTALSTANLSSNTTTSATTTDDELSSFILVPSNQSSSLDVSDVTLKGVFTDLGDSGRWNQLLQPALDELNRRHPDMNIQIEYTDFLYNETRSQILERLSNGSNIDIISVDQIWLGEFAERGLIRDLTPKFEEWGKMSDLYEAIIDGCVYDNALYGLWLWTDIRGLWYWKDMLQVAGIDPESLKTWEGYLSAAARLDEVLVQNNSSGLIEAVHLLGASHSPDMWYPYLWMLGGEILELRGGHSTKDAYWFPSYNNSEGVEAMEFLKQQAVDAEIQPQDRPYLDRAFADRNFSIMLAGSWMPGEFPKEYWSMLEQHVGFIPMFPVPNHTIPTSTMMGGWQLAIPNTSQNSELAWELIDVIAQPEILGPFLQQYGYLPTQRSLGEGPSSEPLKESIPYFDEMVSMIPYGRSRPNIPEYPQIADQIHQAIQQVYNGSASPEDALNSAAERSANLLGWD